MRILDAVFVLIFTAVFTLIIGSLNIPQADKTILYSADAVFFTLFIIFAIRH